MLQKRLDTRARVQRINRQQHICIPVVAFNVCVKSEIDLMKLRAVIKRRDCNA